ncbi:alkaline serine protease Alp1 [Diaporthe helianthi]|uniref:Alkaline serine protease Alp1 n=1 Tax=Diaporthe helianthi TaxID=158607 RepID=A0A2P5I9M2_DIAHE|nr:alkaline serine protease Alp1 [Diaporthe helianthi]
MKAPTLLSFLAGALPLLAAPTEPVRRQDKVIPGKFIVQLKPGSSPESVSAHQLRVRGLLARRDESIKDTYQIGDFNAYSGDFDATTADVIASLPEVLSVVPDEIIYVEKTDVDTTSSSSKRAVTTQTGALWALGDISHTLNGSTDYVYDDRAGEGQTAYVLDTGIRLTHTEFEGTRALWGFNAATGSEEQTGTNSDDDSHGTHVAGSIVGKVNGVAKKAKVVDVKVFSQGYGAMSQVLAGLSWAVNDIISKGAKETSVINMSLSAETTMTVQDEAVLAAYNQGITIIAAAGNNDGPASAHSPARVPEIITIGMTNAARKRVLFYEGIFGSNYGPELDFFAPGQEIVSADYESDTGFLTKTGTSMATPITAGLICYLRSIESGLGTPDAIKARLLELAHIDVVTDPKGSPNRLVYNGSGL